MKSALSKLNIIIISMIFVTKKQLEFIKKMEKSEQPGPYFMEHCQNTDVFSNDIGYLTKYFSKEINTLISE